MSSHFTGLLRRQISKMNFDGAVWVFPIVVGAGWVLWPAMDYEWKMSMGLAADPEAGINHVQQLKDRRFEAHLAASGKKIKKEVEKEDEEEEEEAAEDEEEAGGDEEGGGDDEEEGGGGGDEGGDEEEEEEDEDEEEKKLPSLYDPVKGEHVTMTDHWDNFTLKALRMSDDDDDDDEDDE
jgi:hypothetical protein